jgi:serine protease
MKTRRFDALIAALLVTSALLGFTGDVEATPAATLLQEGDGAVVPAGQLVDQIIIQYAPAVRGSSRFEAASPTLMAELSKAAGMPLTYGREMSGDAHVLKLPARLPPAQVAAIAARLSAQPGVAYAEPDLIAQADFVPNDPRWSDQWHYHAANGIDLATAWDVTRGNRGMIIAVVDTGLLANHPDLVGRTVQGYDMISDVNRANDGNGRDNDAGDPGNWVTMAESTTPGGPFQGCRVDNSDWHGTHVAGTIGASANNNIGVAGITQSQILPVRVLGKCGGTSSDIVDGLRWAAGLPVPGVPANPTPARLLNLSLGGPGACTQTYQNAINDARNSGAIVVVAAGNNSMDASTQTPASCSGVITVAATDQNGNRSVWSDTTGSNFGSLVEISAPGTTVLSTLNDGTTTPGAHNYANYNGTSMAAPHVTGVASLVLDVRPTLNTEQMLDLLQYTSRGFPEGSSCTPSICGSGILNTNDAVRDIFVIKGSANGQGLPSRPYGSLNEAYAAAWNGARLLIWTSSFPGPITLNKNITLAAVGGTVAIGQ